jgi:hypothetical protein
MSTITSLPPDVASSRKTRINRDLLTFLQRPAPLHPNTSSSINPPFQKGIGIYTHIEVPPPPQESLFPHQRFVQQAPRIEFLPLGGPPGRLTRKGVLKADIPDDVREIYDKVKDVVLWEERELRKAGQPDPRVKFCALGLPDIIRPSPPSMSWEGENMEIDQTDHSEKEQERSIAGRKLSLGGSMKNLNVSGSRPSTPGNVTMSGTGASVVRIAAPASASVAKTTSANTTSSATVAGTNESGTLYDPSRDPRRRGR